MMNSFWGLTEVTPNPLQHLWASMFLAFWHLVQASGRASGKTWFWWHVVAYIELQDPDVRAEKPGAFFV